MKSYCENGGLTVAGKHTAETMRSFILVGIHLLAHRSVIWAADLFTNGFELRSETASGQLRASEQS